MPVILPAVKNGMQDQEKDHNGGNGGNNDDKHFDIDKDHIIRPAGHRLVITAEIIGMRILGGKNDLPGTDQRIMIIIGDFRNLILLQVCSFIVDL